MQSCAHIVHVGSIFRCRTCTIVLSKHRLTDFHIFRVSYSLSSSCAEMVFLPSMCNDAKLGHWPLNPAALSLLIIVPDLPDSLGKFDREPGTIYVNPPQEYCDHNCHHRQNNYRNQVAYSKPRLRLPVLGCCIGALLPANPVARRCQLPAV